MILVARHQIGATHVHLFLAVVEEVKDAAVFEITSDDADDLDVIAYAFDAWLQATHAAHEHVHLHSRL